MTGKTVNIIGVSGSAVVPAMAYATKEKGQSLILTATAKRAEVLAKDLSFFSDSNIYVLPHIDSSFIRYEARNKGGLFEKIRILEKLTEGEDCIVLAPVCDALKKTIPKEDFVNSKISISTGDEIEPEEFREKLVKSGYERFSMVDEAGQFASRGDILDIFPVGSEYPVRIEFFDREIDSLRRFNPDTQRTIENISSAEIYPASEIINDKKIKERAAAELRREYEKAVSGAHKEGAEERAGTLKKKIGKLLEDIENGSSMSSFENYINRFYEKPSFIWEYMNDPCIMVDDPSKVCDTVEDYEETSNREFEALLEKGFVVAEDLNAEISVNDYYKALEQENVYIFSPFAVNIKGVERLDGLYDLKSRQPVHVNGKLDIFRRELDEYIRHHYEITIACSSEERKDNLKDFLDRYGYAEKVSLALGELSLGIEYPTEKKTWISDFDIFTGRKIKKKKRSSIKEENRIRSFDDIEKGDYVVHESHGIGMFTGVETIQVEGEERDYLKIKYAGEDVLYVPVDQLGIIGKYSSGDDRAPKLNSLSGTEWKRAKAKARAAVDEMAEDLIELIAKREAAGGYAFGKDGEWQKEFEDSFPYAETDDQLRCIEEIKKDMEKPIAMDRLLCGDVGFGKTEVAARALFKCTAAGKQAAVLVPTTILANQHYNTLKERFEKFPITVEVLSRFKSETEQKKTVERVNEGKVDLVIGTHRLLSEDVKFKDLGLLVIDEEQRFGVRHKEKIKELKNNVDVLTLSATPIPRTLNMSMMGIRDMSVITEPPENRYPVQTYVTEQEDEILRSVITRELDRKGQVYVVYNRVKGINAVAGKIQELVPDADICTGHGQMGEKNLEKVMMDFTEGKYDILVATTIIENGLDISNVNTIIVLETDKFGLSQLYQLRGRVGRSDRIAYAYFMYRPGKVLSEVAEKRLRAIKEYTEFASGFKIALRDLEIRGTGNILGTAQSGHMAEIGYDLYCKFVNEAVRKLKGIEEPEDREETKIEIQISTYIPQKYIEDEGLKLSMYRKIADVGTKDEEDDMIEELTERFGDVPDQTVNLIKISRMRKMATRCSIPRIYESERKVILEISMEKKLNPQGIAKVMDAMGNKVLFHGGVKPQIRITTDRKNRLDDTLRVLENLEE